MTDLVVDASVAIKWVIEEAETEAALRLRRHRLFAPDLLIAECANILWKKVQRAELTEQEARLAAHLLERADIELEPMRPLMESVTKLAIDMNHPAYDCIYLALAEGLSCDLVTADERFARKLLPIGSRSKVLALSTFGS